MPADHHPHRALRVGIAGPVGTGKSTLVAGLCRLLSDDFRLGVVTNDIYTDEDARLLRRLGVLDHGRIRAVQTGCCPHTAIRDDVSVNLLAVADLERDEGPLDVVLVESGGDNLTATFSPALADVQMFVLDTAGGDDVPRKGGPGIERADLLVIAKADIAALVGSDLARMLSDAAERRGGRPTFAADLRSAEDLAPVAHWVRAQLVAHRARTLVPSDPGPMAPHVHPSDHRPHSHVHAH